MQIIKDILGLNGANTTAYLLWSGFLGSNVFVILAGLKGYFNIKKHQQKHHDQLKDHIDYKFSKLTDKSTE
jgi:hypothetical protein